MLRAEVFGGLRFVVDGAEVVVRGAQRRRIAAALLVDAGQVVPARRLADRLDPDASSANALNALQAHIGRLRRTIEPGVPGRDATTLRSAGDGYVLTPDEFDLWEFRAAVEQADACSDRDPASASRRYETALSIWTDPFGALADDPELTTVVEALRCEHLDVEDRWADAVVRAGANPSAAGALLAAAQRAPIRERRSASAMHALAQVGRQSDALRWYDQVRLLLLEELGVDPGPELQEMYQRVLRQDPGLRSHSPELRGAATPSYVDSFVGRRDELDDLFVALGRHRIVTITGMAGVGKTRLARELLRRAASTQITGAVWVPVSRPGEALGVADTMAISLGYGRSGDDLASMTVATLALPQGEFLVVLDGAEARLEECRHTLLTVLSHRPELHVLVTSQVPLALPDEAVVPLAPLALPDAGEPIVGTAVELASDRLGAGASIEAARSVARATGGIPLAVEVVARRPDPGDCSSGTASRSDLLASVIGSTVQRVSPDARRLLRLAAVLPDGLSSEAAQWVASGATQADEPDPWAHHRLLDELVRSSLLAPRATTSTTVHEPPNQVTDEIRASIDDATVRAARDLAVDWLVHLSAARDDELLAPPDQRAQLLLCDEGANVEMAIQHCCAVAHPATVTLACAVVPRVAQLETPHRPGDWLRTVRDSLPLDPVDDARLVVSDVLLCADLASIAARRGEVERARATFENCGRREGTWWLTASLEVAIARGWTGDLAGAGAALDDARRVTSGDAWRTALVDRYQSLFEFASGNAADALALAIETSDRFEDLGDPAHSLATSFYAITIARATGDTRLDALIERAVSHPAAERYPVSSLVLAEAAQAARLRGDEQAERMLRTAIIHLERHGFVRTAATTRRDLGLMLLARTERTAANSELRAAAEWLLLADPMGAGLAVAGLAACAADDAHRVVLADAAWDLVATSGTPPTDDDLRLLSCLVGPSRHADDSRRQRLEPGEVMTLL